VRQQQVGVLSSSPLYSSTAEQRMGAMNRNPRAAANPTRLPLSLILSAVQ
jgi:hypothetical protein